MSENLQDNLLHEFQDWMLKKYPELQSQTQGQPSTELGQVFQHPDPALYLCETRWNQSKPRHPTPLPQSVVGRFLEFENTIPTVYDITLHKAWHAINGSDTTFPCFYRAGPRSMLHHNVSSNRDDLRVGVLTAGGVAPGLNTVVHHLVRRHETYSRYAMESIDNVSRLKIFGFQFGFLGLAGDLDGAEPYNYLVSEESDERLSYHHSDVKRNEVRILTAPYKNSGGSVIGISRGDSSEDQLRRCAQTLRRENINILYCIGGNGTSKGAYLLSEILRQENIRTQICAIPKTIDNDILWSEFSFGVRTAVDKGVEAVEAMYVEARSTGRIAIVEVMGAGSGFIAANVSLASAQCDLCLIPEVHRVIDVPAVAEHIKKRLAARKRWQGAPFAVIVVAEGCKVFSSTQNKTYIDRDAGESAATALKALLGAEDVQFEGKIVIHKAGYVVRSCSPNPSDRLLCRRLASLAVDNMLAGFSNFLLAPTSSGDALVPLRLVAGSDVGGLGGPKGVHKHGRFWAEVSSRNEQLFVDRACLSEGEVDEA